MIQYVKYIVFVVIFLQFMNCSHKADDTSSVIQFESTDVLDSLYVNVDLELNLEIDFEYDFVIITSALMSKKIKSSGNVFKIPRGFSTHKGNYRLLFFKDDLVVNEKLIFFEAGEAKGLIENYLGPKTIWPNGLQEAMLFSVAKDQYQNPQPEGEEINLLSKYPEGTIRRKSPEIKNLHGSYLFSGDEKSSKIYTGSSKGKASGQELETKVVPFWPETFGLKLLSIYPYADRRQRFKIQTDPLFDRFGNIVVDGTKVDFIVENEDGFVGLHQSFTIDGKASVSIQNPGMPDNWNIYGVIGNRIISRSSNLKFDSNIKSFEIEVVANGTQIKIGPIVAALNQMTTDGTEVIASISNGDFFEKKHLETENGFAHLNLSLLVNGTYDIEIKISDKKKSFKIIKD